MHTGRRTVGRVLLAAVVFMIAITVSLPVISQDKNRQRRPPREIQNAMEKQMKAERERRESILQAEGQKASQILVAEGEKQSAILKADAQKQARIMQAEGEATAILKVQQAMADSLKLLNEAAPNDQVIKLKALEALEKVADGKATKLIIPSEIQGLAGLAASAKAVLSDDNVKQ